MPARFVLKVGRGIKDHFPVRVSEWLMTYALLGWGVVLFADPATFSKSPGFSEIARWLDQETWAAICINIGAWRLFALVVNGTFKTHFPYSAHLRGYAALVACFFWGQIVLGVAVAWYANNGGLTGFIAYSTFFLFDVWNLLRAWFDIGVNKVAGDQ